MSGKTTSAGYRVPVSSEYHQNCVSKAVKAIHETIQRTATEKTYPNLAYRNCNVVSQERLWKEYVRNEIKDSKEWEKSWGHLMEYDYQGRPRKKKQLPNNESPYNTTYPMTSSKQVGHRSLGDHIRRLEITTSRKKRKTDLETYATNY